MAESTFEIITRLATASPDGAEALAAAEVGARKVFNRSLKVLCDETDEMGRPLTQGSVDALIASGKMFEAGRGPAPSDGDDIASPPAIQ